MTQGLDFFWQSHSQPCKSSESLGLSGPVAYLGSGVVSPLPTALCTPHLGSPLRLSSSLLPPALSPSSAQPPLLKCRCGQPAARQTPPPRRLPGRFRGGPLLPDFGLAHPLETRASSSFSLLHPSQSNSNSVAQPPQSQALCPLLPIPLPLRGHSPPSTGDSSHGSTFCLTAVGDSPLSSFKVQLLSLTPHLSPLLSME